MGHTSTFSNPRCTPWIWGQTCAVTPRTRLCRSLPAGAYLHVGKQAPQAFAENGKAALALFGSTSPSYLTLTSLDLCNRYLAGGYGGRLADTAARMEALRGTLRAAWMAGGALRSPAADSAGTCGHYRHGIGAEAASGRRGVRVCRSGVPGVDGNTGKQPQGVQPGGCGTGRKPCSAETAPPLPLARGERVMSIRQALFAPHRRIPAGESLGKICGAPTVPVRPPFPLRSPVSGLVRKPWSSLRTMEYRKWMY